MGLILRKTYSPAPISAKPPAAIIDSHTTGGTCANQCWSYAYFTANTAPMTSTTAPTHPTHFRPIVCSTVPCFSAGGLSAAAAGFGAYESTDCSAASRGKVLNGATGGDCFRSRIGAGAALLAGRDEADGNGGGFGASHTTR